MSKSDFMNALKATSGAKYIPACGSATSVVTADLMDLTGSFFPEVHLNAETMANLALAGHTVLGFDNVMPVYSTCQEAAALGCRIDWGQKNKMPVVETPPLNSIDETVTIPADFLKRDSIRTVLDALAILKKRLGDDAAVTGKIFGPWTLAYDVYGVETVLIASLLEPDKLKKALASLLPVTLMFAKAQLEAGADCLSLCDHCTRDLCSPDTYRDFLLEIHSCLAAEIPVPVILHICGNTSDRIKYIRETKVAMFHYDSKTGIEEAVREAGTMPLMGGSSNFSVVRDGSPEDIERDVAEKLEHKIAIIGPECAVPLDAPYQNLKRMADLVKQYRINHITQG